MLDYIKTKLFHEYFKTSSAMASYLGIFLSIASEMNGLVKFLVCLIIVLFHSVWLVIRNGYLAYEAVGKILQNVAEPKIKVTGVTVDPTVSGAKNFLVESGNLQVGQIMVLKVEENEMFFPLGIVHVKSINGANSVQCELICRVQNTEHVENSKSVNFLYTDSIVTLGDLMKSGLTVGEANERT